MTSGCGGELGHLAPADPAGAYERVVEKRVRRGLIRRAQIGSLTVLVLGASALGMLALFRVFGVGETPSPAAPAGSGILFTDEVDGRWDIFLIQEDGSGLTNLTDDAAIDGAPTWSPDASRIAYVVVDSETGLGRVWVMSSDATDRYPITPPMESIDDPTWSPDGGQIAFNAGSSIYVVDASGGEPRRLTDGGRDGSPAWSPDGSTIVFQRLWEAETGATDLFAIPLEGGEPTRITHLDSAYDADWSPDGSQIVFTTVRDLAVLEVATGAVTILTQPDSDDAYDRDASWSPDGTRIVFASDRADGRNMRLYTMDADGSDVRLLFDHVFLFCCPLPDWAPSGETGPVEAVPFAPPESPSPTVSPPRDTLDIAALPDGLLAFAAYTYGPPAGHDIGAVPSHGGEIRLLTSGPPLDTDPEWSPDGTLVAFWRASPEGPTGIYVMDVEGGEPRPVHATAERESITQISWSPDGERLAFGVLTSVDGNQRDMPMHLFVGTERPRAGCLPPTARLSHTILARGTP